MIAPLVVVGDVLLDSDIEGRADRRSPDAGVPVVDVRAGIWRPGGAGLAALLATADAGEVVLVGGFGDDEAGHRLRRLLAGRVRVAPLPMRGTTVCKQRIRAVGPCAPAAADGAADRPVSVVRVDSGDGRIGAGPLPADVEAVFECARGILVADYGHGVAAHPGIRALLARRLRDIPVVWDPHPRGPAPVTGATLVTPNRDEAASLVAGDGDFGDRARELSRRWSARAVAVTLGAEGAVLYRHGTKGTVAVGISPDLRCGPGYDVCGAGDRFAAAATAALASGDSVTNAVRSAVDVAARFVRDGAVSSPAMGETRSDRAVVTAAPSRAAVPPSWA
ncbi:bifunctional hydroxymethylpyrimidine kinase/phosphomethylpyrimidine kinase [Nocardia sp. BSTN01]|uniref:PfkB family carbohydrate kinase n=1 Tax=Nocardia sp. BSTN01 TaxID=2783665 RepID=UPI001890710F|nr:PfkB family carbohydrate kinase [Nocardia sp. BSTN01]MBF4996209.1 bifunctional hydroxymethylpyrimidine kinase/phosphomethylpyrimidine kinase [Nocardia sp. BSTN01]